MLPSPKEHQAAVGLNCPSVCGLPASEGPAAVPRPQRGRAQACCCKNWPVIRADRAKTGR
eukprot:7756980-Lingulodinium_polyedra.AAC.1